MNGKVSPLFSVFNPSKDNLPRAFAHQFLLTDDDDHYIQLSGKMSKVYHPTIFSPLFWILGKFGMLVPKQGENIDTEVKLKAKLDNQGNVIHTYNRKLKFDPPYEFNTTFMFDEKYQMPAESLGPLGIMYMVWKTEFLPPNDFRFHTHATALKFGNFKLWLPKWIWKLLGTTYFEQSSTALHPNQTIIALNIETPFSKKFFGYEGEFEVTKIKKS